MAAGAATRSPRVLILSADLGGGHDALAHALAAELQLRVPGTAVTVRNGLADANSGAYAVMKHAMEGHVTHAPATYGPVYDLVTLPRVSELVRSGARATYGRGLVRDIAAHQPDVVASTFPMITSTLGTLRERGRIASPVVGLVIDSDPHAMWFARGVDEHVVLNPNDVARARALGREHPQLDGLRVSSARPAVDPRFLEPLDRTEARAMFGLPQDRPVVLVSGGSLGLTLPIEELQHLSRDGDVAVAVATGRNEQLLSRLRGLDDPDIVGIPFTREMPRLLGASDAVVSNSGGMTTYESFAAGVPVVFHDPLPGHGEAAAAALARDGSATVARTPAELAAFARTLRDGDQDIGSRALAARTLFDQRPLADAVLAHA
jgi:UDP-N-acetylglucosamine:LPS N-acetylglucosamine transferase